VTFVKGKKKTTEQFDCLMVTTGANAKPKLGPIKAALAGFEGEIIHSADYQKPEVFAGKRVLVVGQGESAADITTEISRHATATASWARRYIILAPRFPHLTVIDKDHDEETIMNDETADIAVNDFLETLTTSRFNVGQNVMMYGSTRQLIWRFLNCGFGPAGKNNLNATEMTRQSLASCNGHGSQVFWMADQSAWVTKNSRMCREVALGNVEHIVSPKIESAQGRTLTFEGGKTVTVDVVVCCTGYGGSFDWITTDFGYDCAENCVRGFYKHAFRGLGRQARVRRVRPGPSGRHSPNGRDGRALRSARLLRPPQVAGRLCGTSRGRGRRGELVLRLVAEPQTPRRLPVLHGLYGPLARVRAEGPVVPARALRQVPFIPAVALLVPP